MDQGLAAVWAGIAGLVGAGIGGGAAVWGATIGGRKAVEAAERQEQRAARSEHQHWQRQARFDAYRALLSTAEEMTRWKTTITVFTAMEMSGRLREAAAGVEILGPQEASLAALDLLNPILDALVDFRSENPLLAAGQPIPHEADFPWPQARSLAVVNALIEFRRIVRGVLDQPPG